MSIIIDKYITLFFLYSFCGWVWETLYCTVKLGSFQCRGFLFGPICPIYGVAITVGQIIYENTSLFDSSNDSILKVFLISFFGSALLEYVTSFYLEKRFHIRWWDYSTMPFNINGRVCLPASMFFGLSGILIVKYGLPFLDQVSAHDINPLLWEFASIVLVGIMCADFALTEASLSSITQHIIEMEKEFTEKGEKVYQTIRSIPGNTKTRLVISKAELMNGIKEYKAHIDWRHRNILWKIRKIGSLENGKDV